MYVSLNSFNSANPYHKKERIANDVKHSLGMGLAVTAGAGASAAILAKPELVSQAKTFAQNNYTTAKNYAKTFASEVKSKDIYKNAVNKAKTLFNQLKGTKIYNNAKEALKPALNYVKNSAIAFKNEAGKLLKTVSGELAKVPGKYKAIALIGLATVALMSKISHNHAYNEGKIDAKYGK